MNQHFARTSIILASLWTAVFLAGCSGQKPYQNTPDNNLHVRTTADSGSWFLKPRSGYQYQVKVTYKDDMYNVVVRETQPDDSTNREIEHKDLRSCQAKSIERSRVTSNSSPR
jgi:hypothetical protein